MSYFILRGLPKQYDLIERPAKSGQRILNREQPSNQEIMEREIFKAWSELFPLFFKSDHHFELNWERSFFGIIGLGMVVYRERPNETLKAHLINIVQHYFQLCLKENADTDRGISNDAWDYLQLLGAWTVYFLGEENLAKKIAETIGQGRPFTTAIGGSSRGHYGIYGYPTHSLGSDFFFHG